MAPTLAEQAGVAVAEKPTTRSNPPQRRSGSVWRLLAAVVVGFAVVGYVVFVKTTRTDGTRLSALVISQTGVGALKSKPVDAEFVAPTKSAFAAVKKAAASDPEETGGYGREWSGSTASGDAATQLVELLPTSGQAKAARTEAEAEYTDAAALKAARTTVTAHFSVPGVAGAFGVRVATAKSSTASATIGTAVVFQQGRVIAVEYLQSSTGGLSQADATAIAQSEHALLARREPGFSLTQTTRPPMLSVVYGLVTVVVATLILTVPGLVRRRRARRQARHIEQTRYEYRARGGKAMRRRRPPAWAQRARSAGPIR
jgi:hypothetical protein